MSCQNAAILHRRARVRQSCPAFGYRFLSHGRASVTAAESELDWAASPGRDEHALRAAGKNVDGRPGRPWPVQLYAPLLVLSGSDVFLTAPGGVYQRERGGASLDLPDGALAQVRDHSAIARAEAALGAEGKAAVNVLVLKTAEQLAFTDRQTLSADTTVQEPAIGYPNEPGILRGWAERIERALTEAQRAGGEGGASGARPSERDLPGGQAPSSVCQNEGGEAAGADRAGCPQRSVERAGPGDQPAGEYSLRAGQTTCRCHLAAAGRGGPHLAATDPAMAEDGESGDREDYSPGYFGRAGDPQRPRPREIWHEVAHQPLGRFLFGERVAARADENKMPEAALQAYRHVFGAQATPKLLVYGFGWASLTGVAPRLKQAGVKQVGIPPRGQGAWQVGSRRGRRSKANGARPKAVLAASSAPNTASRIGKSAAWRPRTRPASGPLCPPI